jgi:hypothetical protein
MKDIYTLYEGLNTSLYEGLLAGMDNTLANGDQLFAKAKSELSTIKTYTDHSNHSLWQSSKYGWQGRRYNEGFNVKALANVLGYWDKIDIMRITITKDGDTAQWVIDITFYNSDYRTASNDSDKWEMAIIRYNVSSVKTFPTLLKKHVAPIFDSIESLKKFMNDNKVR